MKLVVNASPLILLSACGQLHLLSALATEIVVPAAVFLELKAGDHLDRTASLVEATDGLRIENEPPTPGQIQSWDLGSGETAVLSWAAVHPGFTAVLDDRAARNCAGVLQLPTVGTLGVVLAAKEAGLIPEARPVVEELRQAGHYLSERLLEDALRSVGE